MLLGLRRAFYSTMYFFGKQPPTAADISAEFGTIEREIAITDDDPLCDCQIIAKKQTIECKTRRTSVCEAMGERRPDVHAVPHKVGFCGTLQEDPQ
jgi:hypothetical protein